MARNVRVEVRSIIAKLPPGTERRARNVIEKTAERIRDRGKANIAKETGETAETIRYVMVGPATAEVGSDSPVGAFLEFGTEPHVITPRNAGVLVFEVGSETVFTTFVDHPGTSPQPWLLPALERERPELERRIKQDLGGWLEDQSV